MIVLATLVACGLILAQLGAVWAFLRFVKSFGAYTASQEKLAAALLYTHESNLAVHESNRQLLDRLAAMQERAKEVA